MLGYELGHELGFGMFGYKRVICKHVYFAVAWNLFVHNASQVVPIKRDVSGLPSAGMFLGTPV